MRVALLFALILLASKTAAQVTVEVAVVDDRQQPLPRARVTLQEGATGDLVQGNTDPKGEVSLLLRKAGSWVLAVNGHNTGHEPITVRDGEVSKSIVFLSYNPKLDARTDRQSFDRRGMSIEAMGPVPAEPGTDWNIVEIQVVDSRRQRKPGLPVRLVSLAERKCYEATTGADGVARFHVPGARPYDIDVAEHRNAGYLLMEDRANYTLTQVVTYDSYEMQERRRGDTIAQSFALPVTQRASRALYRLRITRDGGPWRKGIVYLDATGSKDVYTARTDTSGTAWFLLPFGVRYLLHFPYERDVTAINLLHARQEARGSADIVYRPDPKLEFPERYLPRPGELTLTGFRYFHRTAYPAGPKPHLEASSNAVGKGAVLHFGIGGMRNNAQTVAPRNYCFVLDVSGSMAGYERLESMQRGLRQLLSGMRPSDRVSIITFSDACRVVVPSVLAGGNGARIDTAVASIEPLGGTNMLEALRLGYRFVNDHWRPETDNRVILLSDGFDENPTDTLYAVQKPYRGRIACQAIGVGSDYNSELLSRLSDAGGLQQAREGAELERYLREGVLNSAPVATDISFSVVFGRGAQLRSVYGLDSLTRNANGFSGTLPRLLAGEDLPCIARFAAADSLNKDKNPVQAIVRMRFRNNTSGMYEAREDTVELRFNEPASTTTLPESEKMFAVAFCNEQLERLMQLIDVRNFRDAMATITRAVRAFEESPGWKRDEELGRLLAQFNRYAGALRAVQGVKEKTKNAEALFQ